tara:strand:+ start:386 stop:583 length:198 start_codon:yes stop_codon:yes gene_type:complete
MNIVNNNIVLSILLKLKLNKTTIKNIRGTNFGISKEFKKIKSDIPNPYGEIKYINNNQIINLLML